MWMTPADVGRWNPLCDEAIGPVNDERDTAAGIDGRPRHGSWLSVALNDGSPHPKASTPAMTAAHHA